MCAISRIRSRRTLAGFGFDYFGVRSDADDAAVRRVAVAEGESGDSAGLLIENDIRSMAQVVTAHRKHPLSNDLVVFTARRQWQR